MKDLYDFSNGLRGAVRKKGAMKVWMGFSRAKTQVIEWADSEKTRPVAFFAICPKCGCKQWAKVDDLYVAYDGTKHNLRCKKCLIGKTKPGDKLRRKLETFKTFNPRNTGWQSIVNNNAKQPKSNKPPHTK